MKSFIETQFPIARLSAESYKERKAGASQTLTGIGKWWGRKPLILVRASILGMLMPASNNPKKDREIFLKALTMDDEGTWLRNKGRVKSREEFLSLSYAQRLKDCDRPENSNNPSPLIWEEINSHLETRANNLTELINQLGHNAFGRKPRVGDSFCGGGSIPFEAARIGCDSFASDLNPVAGLLTWASLNILGGGAIVQREAQEIQEKVFADASNQLESWGIEQNDKDEKAEAYLYCVEVKPDGCDFYIPISPSWIISEKYRVVAKWKRVIGSEHLLPEIVSVSEDEFKLYKNKKGATLVDGRVVDPENADRSWSIEALRGAEGLRKWTNDDIVPRKNDVFQDRLYCIRWIDSDGKRRYSAPDAADLEREAKVLTTLREYFHEWQQQGFIPSKAISSGYNTDQPVRERGWTCWHHLFTPRQLLILGLLNQKSSIYDSALSKENQVALLVRSGMMADFHSKLCRWDPSLAKSGGIGACIQTFYNQAYNTLYNFGSRSSLGLQAFSIGSRDLGVAAFKNSKVILSDARDLREFCDIWITDPPYADAVNYHELGDFFLAWYEKRITKIFPDWSSDARAELAVRGDGDDFRHSMVEVYRNLAAHMPDNGMQMVMFTHQDPAVWADLGMIMWAAGLKVTAAWTISTETEAAGIKKGNYVQGTVCLVLRKRKNSTPGFLDEVYPLVEDEVKNQILSMQALDEGGEPNFNDADYQLAAYAAALKVLTQYSNLDGKDVEHEVFTVRKKNQKSDFQIVIERALGIACDTLIPRGLDNIWRELSLVERYYLRALDIESRGERRQGMYEELARGFGVADIKPLLKNDKANGARMNTPIALAASLLSSAKSIQSNDLLPVRQGRAGSGSIHPFASSSLRYIMFAIRETALSDNNPELGRQYLRDTFGSAYWTKRERIIGLLEWLSFLANSEGMSEWTNDSEAARILAGRLRNDHA